MNQLAKKVILLVEDDAIIAMAEEALLNKYGVSVVKAYSGRQAVEAFQSDRRFDLVLMDIDLGDGIDGTEAATEILRNNDVPIVFLTSHTEPEYVERTEEISSYGYVVKNSGEMVLMRSITMALRLYSAHILLKESHDEIAREGERYHLLFTNLTAGFALHEMIYDEHGVGVDFRFLDVNPAYEAVTGLRVGELIGKTAREVLPGIEQYWIDACAGVVETGEAVEFENYSSDLQRYFDLRVFRHDRGKFAMVISDVTPRRQAEDRLRQQQEYLSTMLNSIGDGVISTDREGRVLMMNPIAEELTGWTMDSAKERRFAEVFVIEDSRTGETSPDPVAGVLETNEALRLSNHTTLSSRDGRQYQIADSAAPIRKEDHTVDGVVLVFRDVSEQYKQNREIAEAKLQLESVIESVQEGITVLNRDLTIQRVNSTVRKWFSHTSELVGEKCYDVYRGGEERCEKCPVRRSFASGKPERSELRGYGDALVEWLEVFAYPIPDPETGEIRQVVEFQRDITEQKQREQHLQRQERKYSNLFNDSAAVMLLIDPVDGSIVDANKAAGRYYGWPPEQLKKMSVFDINTMGAEEITATLAEAGARRKSLFQFQHRRANGSIREVQVVSGPIQPEGDLLLHSVILDFDELGGG